ncbi:hypothetical protein POX_a01609 [Penicillium oxalicum]|uniref:hypothetical protein n=1 Tax=Penicillium oxalicum TaxID=69781 RepID=UPI0020B77821|nr:hypothetical protein POX_a01609 [Penicillium oxalicum]KAI2795006.1 hypothetical protein POX_a01609 [Penicillium oxalicum]
MKFWIPVLLVALFSGTPEGFQDHWDHWQKRDEGPPGLHIGYRVILKEEAERVYNNGWKAVPPDGTRGRQTGAGAYLLRGFQEWEVYPDGIIRYDCVATIDAAVWNSWKKIWLPRLFEFPEDKEKDPETCKPLELWGMRPEQSPSDNTERNRARFLKYLDPSLSVDTTVIFSRVLVHEDKIQVLIPDALVLQNELRLWPCAQRGTEENPRLARFGTASWDFSSLPGYDLGTNPEIRTP